MACRYGYSRHEYVVFNESDVGMMAALLLAYIVCGVINGVPLGWWILWKARQSERLDSGIVPELRRDFTIFHYLSMGLRSLLLREWLRPV